MNERINEASDPNASAAPMTIDDLRQGAYARLEQVAADLSELRRQKADLQKAIAKLVEEEREARIAVNAFKRREKKA